MEQPTRVDGRAAIGHVGGVGLALVAVVRCLGVRRNLALGYAAVGLVGRVGLGCELDVLAGRARLAEGSGGGNLVLVRLVGVDRCLVLGLGRLDRLFELNNIVGGPGLVVCLLDEVGVWLVGVSG